MRLQNYMIKRKKPLDTACTAEQKVLPTDERTVRSVCGGEQNIHFDIKKKL